jgi:hypothetical protein
LQRHVLLDRAVLPARAGVCAAVRRIEHDHRACVGGLGRNRLGW